MRKELAFVLSLGIVVGAVLLASMGWSAVFGALTGAVIWCIWWER